jgi:hypothetical protein
MKEFVQQSIRSVDALDLLVFLYSEASRSWSAREIARLLLRREGRVAAILELLARADLLDVHVGSHVRYRYHPIDAHLGATVSGLMNIYSRRSSAVLAMLPSRRTSALREFSDAFGLARGRTRA